MLLTLIDYTLMPIFDKHCLDIRQFLDSNKIPSVSLDSISNDDTTELIAHNYGSVGTPI